MFKKLFHPNPWQMMTFLNPLDALIPKTPFSFFAEFWVRVTSEAQGSVSLGFWGPRQLSPFWGRGLARGLYRPPPPSIESPSTPGARAGGGGVRVLLPLCRVLYRVCFAMPRWMVRFSWVWGLSAGGRTPGHERADNCTNMAHGAPPYPIAGSVDINPFGASAPGGGVSGVSNCM